MKYNTAKISSVLATDVGSSEKALDAVHRNCCILREHQKIHSVTDLVIAAC